MKVYIIMSGCIDDRFLYGVYTTIEKAQTEIDGMRDDDKQYCDIEEWEAQ